MKNTHIIVVVIVLLVLGLFMFMRSGDEAKLPVAGEQNSAQENVQVESDDDTTSNVEVKSLIDVDMSDIREFTITGKNFSMAPDSIKVKKGETVRITFKNVEGFHDLVIDEFNVKSKQGQSPSTEVLEFTASKTGTFDYYCSVGSHRELGMVGKLIVE